MNTAKNFGLGTRVKIVPQHWLRGGEVGRLVRFEQRGQNNWLVQFDRCYPGGGIDGDKLWLGQREIIAATDEDIAMNCMSGANDEDETNFLPAHSNGLSQSCKTSENGSHGLE